MSAKNLTMGIDLGYRRPAVCDLSAAGGMITETEVISTRGILKRGLVSPSRPFALENALDV